MHLRSSTLFEVACLWALIVSGVFFVASLVIPAPVSGQQCISVPEDRAKIEARGWEWLGIRDIPFTDNDIQMVYYRNGSFTVMSLVVGGCVARSGWIVGPYKAETRA